MDDQRIALVTYHKHVIPLVLIRLMNRECFTKKTS